MALPCPIALIPAAGRGSRLGPLTDERPKCLLPFAGRPLLHWQKAALAAAGVTETGLVRGYQGRRFDGEGLRLWDNPDWADTNMVASILCAGPDLLAEQRPVLVCYGDIVYEPRLVRALLDCPDDIAVIVDLDWRAYWSARSDDPLADAESLRMTADQRITDIGRRVQSLDEIQAQYTGLVKFSPRGFARFAETYGEARPGDGWLMGREPAKCYMTDMLRALIEQGETVRAVPVHGGWLEFDTGEDVALYQRWHADGSLAQRLDLGAIP